MKTNSNVVRVGAVSLWGVALLLGLACKDDDPCDPGFVEDGATACYPIPMGGTGGSPGGGRGPAPSTGRSALVLSAVGGCKVINSARGFKAPGTVSSASTVRRNSSM